GDPAIRALFTREHMLASDWHAARLAAKQAIDLHLWEQHVHGLEAFTAKPAYAAEAARLDIAGRLARARRRLGEIRSPEYLEDLHGTIGAQPLAAFTTHS